MSKNHDFTGLYRREIDLRKKLEYPPFSRLINLRIEGTAEHDVYTAAKELAAKAMRLQKKGQPEVLGPAPSPLVRLRDRFRYQLLLKGRELEALHSLAYRLTREISLFNKAGKVKVTVDVDPEFMM